MKYLLDTNAVIGFVNRNSGLRHRIRQEGPAEFGLSALVTHELYFGAFKGLQAGRNLALIEGLEFEVLPFDDADARLASVIRAQLANQGTPIDPYDVLIAGQALVRDLTVVTHNIREFSRVPGLRVEDWQT
jgi:tRNA(fMet)-specific endonuclease VapC